MLNELKIMCEEWCTADNGLAAFLEKRNKSSIDEYLIGVGLKQRKPKPVLKSDKVAAKAERRRAHLKEHPEHAGTVDRKQKQKPKSRKGNKVTT